MLARRRPYQLGLILAVTLSALAGPAFAAEPTIEDLLNATDDIARGTSSHATLEMQVKTARYERTMTLEAWSKGEEKSLIRILEPAKDAGISTLMVDDNIWNYLPKVDRTMKVPGAMMSGSWMGSHFSNDDLVKANRLADEFTGEISSRPADNADKHYVVTLIPKPDAAVVWGKVVVRTTAELMPFDVRYFDEDSSLKRTMKFEDYRDFDGRKMPAKMTLLPATKPDEYTRIVYRAMEFDIELEDKKFFSLQQLKR
jgi:outer membrane lipoprotein-sorting protein